MRKSSAVQCCPFAGLLSACCNAACTVGCLHTTTLTHQSLPARASVLSVPTSLTSPHPSPHLTSQSPPFVTYLLHVAHPLLARLRPSAALYFSLEALARTVLPNIVAKLGAFCLCTHNGAVSSHGLLPCCPSSTSPSPLAVCAQPPARCLLDHRIAAAALVVPVPWSFDPPTPHPPPCGCSARIAVR